MSRLLRLALSPFIFPAYIVYGAVKGGQDGTGAAKGSMLGALFAATYVITGDRLKMEDS